MLTLGQEAPFFSGLTQEGETRCLSDYVGRNLVVFFYPKDSTPGCTLESQGFSAQKEVFQRLNTEILGVSKDSVASHQRFCQKSELSVDLLSDPEGAMTEAYGVWQEKKNYGKTYMGIVRSTFLIDSKGILQQVWSPVRVKGHVDDVLRAVQSHSADGA